MLRLLLVVTLAACAGRTSPPVYALDSGDLTLACGRGTAAACFAMGLRHLTGAWGAPVDRRLAQRLLLRACQLDLAAACHNAAMLLHREDPAHADTLFARACDQGYGVSCHPAVRGGKRTGADLLRRLRKKRVAVTGRHAGPRTILFQKTMPKPVRTHGANPQYPEEAKAAGIAGFVVVLLTITPTGDVINVRVIRDLPILGEVCRRTVGTWRFQPVRYRGQTVSVIVKQPFLFKLLEPEEE